jgi:hypothetical protein
MKLSDLARPQASGSASIRYTYSRESDSLPDPNDMPVLSHYVVTHKRRRGPNITAFVAPEFASAGMKKVFAGFTKVVGLSLNFCGSDAQARTMITTAIQIN